MRVSPPFKLIAFDVDGVFTNGDAQYSRDGKITAKTFNDKDLMALRKFQAAGIHVCIITGSDDVNLSIFQRRGVEYYHSKFAKRECLDIVRNRLGLEWSDVAAVGDDVLDIPMLREVGRAYCPNDAVLQVASLPNVKILPWRGGDQLVSKFFDGYFGSVDTTALAALYAKEIENRNLLLRYEQAPPYN